MDDGSILALAVMVALIALSGFFSAVETAFSSLNEIRLKSRAEDGDAAAARVLAMAQQHDKLFSTILVGDTIANLAAASLGVLLLIRPLGALRGTIVSAVVLAVVILLFGEIGPRSMAREIPEKVATASVPAMRFFIPLLTPLTGLFGLWNKLITHCFHSKAEPDSITEGELITMVSEAESEGELTDREGELIRSAIEFDDVEVGEILTPRVDVVAVKDTVSYLLDKPCSHKRHHNGEQQKDEAEHRVRKAQRKKHEFHCPEYPHVQAVNSGISPYSHFTFRHATLFCANLRKIGGITEQKNESDD